MTYTKPFNIPKSLVYKAYKLVKAKAGSAGVDNQTIADFDKNLESNLYKLWNRLSSGAYFPPPVKVVAIPKKTGGERYLGIPTVMDRIAQMTVKYVFEPQVEPIFDPDSYGYRPYKSALEAVGVTRKRCWYKNWVLEFDIKGLFDNIDHALLLKAVTKHTDNKWVLLYIKRWLKSPRKLPSGKLEFRDKGVPQGGVISPVLANLFLHYVFDTWMRKEFSQFSWCRYADDALIHTRTKKEANLLLSKLAKRFEECGLELHRKKTRIVYCNSRRYPINYRLKSFDFLGYTFRNRLCLNPETKGIFVGFIPGISKEAVKSIRAKIRALNIRNRTDWSLNKIALVMNPIIRGWLNYYGRYTHSALEPVLRHINLALMSWAMRKYKKLHGRKTAAAHLIWGIAKRQPGLFEHWKRGWTGVFA